METTRTRSELMKRVRREGTSPEVLVRKLLTSIGGRYRLNVRGLPGSPDIANRSRRRAIFVHGCFWHFHRDCPRGRIPKRNRNWWQRKLERNRERDGRKVRELEEMGFEVLVVWACQLHQEESMKNVLEDFWSSSDV